MLVSTAGTSHAVSAAAQRLGLVPISPGGSESDPPLYSAAEAARISFGVFIDPELHGDAEEYLRQRAQLCLAGYGVQLFAVGATQGELLLDDEGGAARVDPAQLKSGVTYGWRVIAALQDGSEVLSTPLYFRVSDEEPDSGAGLRPVIGETPDPAQMLLQLERMHIEQQREAAALRAYLKRTMVFETYPTSSTSYICAPIAGGEITPLPAQLRSGLVPTQILPLLGTLMQQADVVQEALRTDEPAADKLDTLIGQLGDLLGSVSYGRALTARAPALAGIVKRLEGAKGNPEQTVALLSELRLALDSAIGFGSINLRQDYEDAFSAYADMASERLSLAANWELLKQVFGEDEALPVLNIVNDQRGALALLRDEVARGRLSKTQLTQRLSTNAKRAEEATLRSYEIIEGSRCAIVGTPKNVDSARLQQEQFRCRLAHLVQSVWAD